MPTPSSLNICSTVEHIFCEPGVSPVQVDLTFENMGKDNIGVIGTAASIFAFLFSPRTMHKYENELMIGLMIRKV